jgi:hypothetical protein
MSWQIVALLGMSTSLTSKKAFELGHRLCVCSWLSNCGHKESMMLIAGSLQLKTEAIVAVC